MTENEIAKIIVDAAIEVHRELGGPGLLEDIYEEALAEELRLRGLKVERQLPVGLALVPRNFAVVMRAVAAFLFVLGVAVVLWFVLGK